jgi:hypothetical protein
VEEVSVAWACTHSRARPDAIFLSFHILDAQPARPSSRLISFRRPQQEMSRLITLSADERNMRSFAGFSATLVALALSLSATIAQRAGASLITFSAKLDAQHARPPNLVPAYGAASGTLDDTTGTFTISGTSHTASPVASAEVRGPTTLTDSTGPVIVQLSASYVNTDRGVDGTFSGSSILSPEQISDLLAGNYFVSVETTSLIGPAPPLGGSLTVPEPSAFGLICLIGLATHARRRRLPKPGAADEPHGPVRRTPID